MLVPTLVTVLGLTASVQSQSTAGVPAVQNVGTGAPVAVIPDGRGGLSTGTAAQFTPGANVPLPSSPYVAPMDAAGSASLASILTHFSQAITAATPTTGPPTGISSGIEGGFTGTSSVLDGRIATIANAATTYTGPRPSSTSEAATNAAFSGTNTITVAMMATFVAFLAGALTF